MAKEHVIFKMEIYIVTIYFFKILHMLEIINN